MTKETNKDYTYDAALGVGGEDWIRFQGTTPEVIKWLETHNAERMWHAGTRKYMSVEHYKALVSQLPHAS